MDIRAEDIDRARKLCRCIGCQGGYDIGAFTIAMDGKKPRPSSCLAPTILEMLVYDRDAQVDAATDAVEAQELMLDQEKHRGDLSHREEPRCELTPTCGEPVVTVYHDRNTDTWVKACRVHAPRCNHHDCDAPAVIYMRGMAGPGPYIRCRDHREPNEFLKQGRS